MTPSNTEPVVPATADATPLSVLTQNLIQNAFTPIAAAHNETVVLDYNNAVAAAQLATSRGFPTALPDEPMLWSPNTQAIADAEAAAPGKGNWDPSVIFIQIPYVPIVPAPPALTPLSLGQADPNRPGFWEMKGDNQNIPAGTRETVDGHGYKKTLIDQTPFGPVYEWQRVS